MVVGEEGRVFGGGGGGDGCGWVCGGSGAFWCFWLPLVVGKLVELAFAAALLCRCCHSGHSGHSGHKLGLLSPPTAACPPSHLDLPSRPLGLVAGTRFTRQSAGGWDQRWACAGRDVVGRPSPEPRRPRWRTLANESPGQPPRSSIGSHAPRNMSYSTATAACHVIPPRARAAGAAAAAATAVATTAVATAAATTAAAANYFSSRPSPPPGAAEPHGRRESRLPCRWLRGGGVRQGMRERCPASMRRSSRGARRGHGCKLELQLGLVVTFFGASRARVARSGDCALSAWGTANSDFPLCPAMPCYALPCPALPCSVPPMFASTANSPNSPNSPQSLPNSSQFSHSSQFSPNSISPLPSPPLPSPKTSRRPGRCQTILSRETPQERNHAIALPMAVTAHRANFHWLELARLDSSIRYDYDDSALGPWRPS
ncbi:hypothetical protein AOQ84DRAFT_223241 [Glonium stellatum]|uniref:Uncharacterized protein n=1 Tax=Glonium stellatum TaxID=574774 RepID=A0A8E2EYK7_9PEZI|nr:hypothetical protein AOQ84DRAFT_223241 [Glonium stellatum]